MTVHAELTFESNHSIASSHMTLLAFQLRSIDHAHAHDQMMC